MPWSADALVAKQSRELGDQFVLGDLVDSFAYHCVLLPVHES